MAKPDVGEGTRLAAATGAWICFEDDLAACTLDQLAATVRNRLRRIQYRPELITGFLGQTGLSLEPEPP